MKFSESFEGGTESRMPSNDQTEPSSSIVTSHAAARQILTNLDAACTTILSSFCEMLEGVASDSS